MALIQNHLIELLPEVHQQELLAMCEKTVLVRSELLWKQDERLAYVYFPIRGLISLTQRPKERPGLEIGMIGREGMLGTRAALGVTETFLQAFVQVEGWAWRVRTELLHNYLDRCSAFKSVLDRYVAVRMAQLSTASTCLHYHEVTPRLARWFLAHQDRAGSDHIHITQDLLGDLLGARRVSITNAAGELQRRGLIEYQRGDVTILNRSGLKAAACSCYEADLAEYGKVMSAGCQ
jgi:CRP-like cAMP-binding protein